MVKTQLQPVVSAEQTLVVGQAFGDIIAVNYPSYAETGEVIGANVLVKNTGDTLASFDVNFWWVNADLYGGVARQDMGWSDEGRQDIAAGEQKWFTKATLITMPVGDAWLKARSFIMGFWPGTDVWCDDFDFTVEQLLKVATTLTLAFTPARVPLSGAVTCTGRLTRNDTGAGIGGATVAVQLLIGTTWTSQKTGTADANGNYSLVFAAPATTGSYKIRARYDGSAVLGMALSEEASMQVGIVEALSMIPLLVSGLTGAGVAYAASRKAALALAGAVGGGLAGYVVQRRRLSLSLAARKAMCETLLYGD